jgi:MHS family alpha-ketoglutarate permease-like MFS transporter
MSMTRTAFLTSTCSGGVESDTGVRQRLFSIFGGSVGNLIEWYDFYIYSAFSLYFAKAFFPSNDPLVEQLNTAGVFAIGFLIRPIGGWVMGLYAEAAGPCSWGSGCWGRCAPCHC